MGALPLAAQILHLPSAFLTQFLGLKPVAIATIGASRLAWLPLVAMPFVSLSEGTETRIHAAINGPNARRLVLVGGITVALYPLRR